MEKPWAGEPGGEGRLGRPGERGALGGPADDVRGVQAPVDGTGETARAAEAGAVKFSEKTDDEDYSDLDFTKDSPEVREVIGKLKRAAEKIKALYGGQEGYERLLTGTRAFFDSVRAWVPPSKNWFHAAVPHARRLKVEADAIRQVLVDREGGAFDARFHHDHQIGRFAGFSEEVSCVKAPCVESIKRRNDMRNSAFIVSLLLGFISLAHAQGYVHGRPGTSYNNIGGTTFGSDGTTYNQIGNTTFGSDGRTSTQIGNSTFHSDGTTSTQIGNTLFNSDGSSINRIGNTTFGSDGTTCTKIGNSTFCN